MTPENVECPTCDGTRRRQVDQYGNVWGDKLAEAMPTIIVGDIPCPDCTPENVEFLND